jgi:hypothetical protein
VKDPETERLDEQHTLGNVHRAMMLQIARDYAGLPDVRTLTASEIRFFYDGLRAELREGTKPRPKKNGR